VNILAFFAHPDDETVFAGGALALLAQQGAQVHFLCATRGEGGETGEPPLCTQEQLGEVREQELICAVQALGGRSLTFLGYTDPRVGAREELFPYTQDLTFLAGQVAATIRQFQIEAVITHGSRGEYGHPAHQLNHRASRLAVESLWQGNGSGKSPLLYTVSASFPEHPRPRLVNPDDPADIILDITPVLDSKTKALLCHRTQHALFVRRSSQEAGRQLTVPEVAQRRESLHRVIPPWDGTQKDRLAEMLSPWAI
jgi:LmbE family N-acetylglucosaminyl deacetylase